ncbi:hypothetical protein R50072_25350 [Simiduia litorea]
MFSHRNLGNDIIEGEGEFLSNLLGYFRDHSLVVPSLAELKQLLYQNKQSYEFANAIRESYRSAWARAESNKNCAFD